MLFFTVTLLIKKQIKVDLTWCTPNKIAEELLLYITTNVLLNKQIETKPQETQII